MEMQSLVILVMDGRSIDGLTLMECAAGHHAGGREQNRRADRRMTLRFFSELLSNMYDHGLWAEMISDRKFFYPINSSPTQTPQNSRRFDSRWNRLVRMKMW